MLDLSDKRRSEEREELLGESDSDFFPRLTLLGMARKKSFDYEFCRRWGIHAGAARQAERLAEQFLKIAEKIFEKDAKKIAALSGNAGAEKIAEMPQDEAVRRCLLLGFVSQLAKRADAGTLRCALVHGRRGELRKNSAARRAKLFVAAEVDEIQTRGDVSVFLSLATAVEELWLEEYFPDDFERRDSVSFDFEQKRVLTRRERVFRGLVLSSREIPDVSSDAASRLLADEVLAGRLVLENWDEQVEAWIRKVNFAARHCPELGISPIDEDGRRMLIEELCLGATAYKDIREKSVWKTLRGWLSREQDAAMDAMLPDSISLPRKRHPAKIFYNENLEAVIGATVQELYDCSGENLKICGGRIPLIVEIQSPARRTVQRTANLDAFWKTSYENVKKELKGRYPKHEWR